MRTEDLKIGNWYRGRSGPDRRIVSIEKRRLGIGDITYVTSVSDVERKCWGYTFASWAKGEPAAVDALEAERNLKNASADLFRELKHLVRLLGPLEERGDLQTPGLATLNGARAALAKAEGREG